MARTHTRLPRQPRARLSVRVSPEQKALFERASALQGQSLTAFLIQSAQAAAEGAIRNHEIIDLTAHDTEALVAALLTPPPPNEALRAALRRHRELVESRVMP